MAFKMRGFSAFTKMTDPPKGNKMMKEGGPKKNIEKMLAEYNALENKKNRTEAETKKMNELGRKLDAHYGDDNRG
tara:strand:- start:646 stop:870 length:225 start_codon:yes stop_codon:yes gene_type:complete